MPLWRFLRYYRDFLVRCCACAPARQPGFTRGSLRTASTQLSFGYRVGLRGEKRGSHPRIVRDALDIDEVKAALDQNFERIQNIMFSRINHLAAIGSGPAEVEDDGYD